MNTKIDSALNVLYQRQISSREQLLNEMLRVKMVAKSLDKDIRTSKDKERLFQLMKKTTEDDLGFFPADRDDFWDIFDALRNIDLIDFAVEIYKNDRSGTVISPACLSNYVCGRMRRLKPHKILITEAEKHLSRLRELIECANGEEITLTTQIRPMHMLLQLAFGDRQNIRIRFESIYTGCLAGEKFDYIYSLPVFGARPEELAQDFLTRDSDGVALENMLGHLNNNGVLDIILPARITFACMGFEKLRAHIAGHFHLKSIYILPEGTFRPTTAIKTYLLSITTAQQPGVEVGTLELARGNFQLKDRKEIPTNEFLSHEDWRVEMLMADDDENIRRFKSTSLAKVKLKQVAEVFRGKSILKKDTSLGNISVLNISNIENGEINYADMDTIDEDERKAKRYELQAGDVVLTSRGTAVKAAVFAAQDKTIIASANLIVIRPKEEVKGEFIKIFFESPVGRAIIKSFQRGTTVMNINYADIMEMEIPLLPLNKQQEIIEAYNREYKTYKEAIKKAESRWFNKKEIIYNELI